MRRRGRIVRRGTPAALVLAHGVSRHGAHCSCVYCRAPVADALLAALGDLAGRDPAAFRKFVAELDTPAVRK